MLQVFWAAFQSVIVLFLFVAAGFVIRRTGMVKADFSAQLSKVLFNFFMPCMLLDMILSSVDLQEIVQNGSMAGISLAVMGVSILLGSLLWLFLRKRGTVFSVPAFALGFPNFAFMGIPVTTALYGEKASATLLMYILPLYLLVNIAGYMIMTSQKKIDWKNVLNPCTIAILAGILLKLLPFSLPDFFMQTMAYGANVVSPLAMFSVGLVIGGCAFGKLRENADLVLVSAVRLLVLPLCLLGLLWLLGLRGLSLAVPVIVTAMPVAANMTILAGACNRHEEVSARVVFLSTLLSLLTIPLVAGLIPVL